ncbi:MAG: hypothetical protein JWO22_3357 [Frankiales bacterium]|nr:hypothetical protein [Frankiales bacterium]
MADTPGVTPDPEEHVERLRAAVLALKAPQAAKRAPAPTSSVFGRAARAVPDDVRPRTSREALAAKVRNVETSALMAGTTMVLVVCPDPGPLPPSLMKTLDLLVSSGAVAVALGPDLPRDVPTDRSRPLTLPLRTDDDLSSEWALLALGPEKRVAFLARRGTDGWDWMITRDPVAVHRAGTAILERVPFLRLRVPLLED